MSKIHEKIHRYLVGVAFYNKFHFLICIAVLSVVRPQVRENSSTRHYSENINDLKGCYPVSH